MAQQNSPRWYREPAMLIVAGVLLFTVTSGTAMLTFSLTHRDSLVMTDDAYQEWRDEMRATSPPQLDD